MGCVPAMAAETASPAAVLGPWIFGSVALVLVAALGYLAGRAASAGRPQAPRPQPSLAPREHAAADAPQPHDSGAAPAPGPGAGELADHQARTAPSAADEASAFSYTVSNDLRAPLRVVEGFARILKEDYGRQLDRMGNDHLDRVLGAAARMNAIIDAMLSLASLSAQPLARQPVDLTQLALYIVDDLRRGTPTREVRVEIEHGLRITGDPTLMRQALENLLSNAWKYTARREDACISFRALDVDRRRCFEVADNGAGFDMRSADRLFGLFQRLHSANDFPGTGVGLASVRRIVQRHGGDIWAESQPGQGTRFRFTLAD